MCKNTFEIFWMLKYHLYHTTKYLVLPLLDRKRVILLGRVFTCICADFTHRAAREADNADTKEGYLEQHEDFEKGRAQIREVLSVCMRWWWRTKLALCVSKMDTDAGDTNNRTVWADCGFWHFDSQK